MTVSITSDNINRLLDQLGKDRSRVSASTNPRKLRAQLLILHLTNGLQAALMDAESTWNGWMLDLQQTFADLSSEMNAILGDEMGACDYNGDCIPSTRAQCDCLTNSHFRPGGTCPRPATKA
jgi:hypothetical protein